MDKSCSFPPAFVSRLCAFNYPQYKYEMKFFFNDIVPTFCVTAEMELLIYGLFRSANMSAINFPNQPECMVTFFIRAVLNPINQL